MFFLQIEIVLTSIDSAQRTGLKTNLWLKEQLPFGKTFSRFYHIGKGFANRLDHHLNLRKHYLIINETH